MNLPRPTRTTLALSLCLLALAGTLGYEHYQLSKLTNGLAATADKESLDALLTRLTKVDERLDTVDGKHLVTNEDFRAGQQALSNRLDAVQTYAKQATETVQELSRNAASTAELVMLKASVETMDIRLKDLSKVQVRPATISPSKPKPTVPKTAPAPKAVTVSPPPAPPFNVLGVEYRGGERFLSVAPPGSTQLSEIYLIRPGDAVAGTSWRLRSLTDGRAAFDVAGSPQTITLTP
ncbi:methyl-accepting chemotaxis protein [Pseudomonas chlororaphis]|uniref:methyl-accepting chemotaxis protein n=1 Tax=Pseudomonas chlororaphis TaxID=587753 RepID=UPI00209C67E3|nr:methyl-accepting chemotaxis protein [Pseudomonas chlororaphis]